MKALVTDSSQTVRTRMSRMLMESGFEVSQAKDGAQALAFLSAHPETDLVLTDWQMPSVPGLELTTAIRADAHFDHVRVVTVTMHSDAASVRSAFRAVVDDFIMTPIMTTAAHEKLMGLRFPMYARDRRRRFGNCASLPPTRTRSTQHVMIPT
jgi:two-component system chemotaxis response regulator CheY